MPGNEDKRINDNIPHTRVCANCGKIIDFIAREESMWAYKYSKYKGRKAKYFCTYTCMNKYKSDTEKKSKEKKCRKWTKEEDEFLLKNFEKMPITKLAKTIGVAYETCAKRIDKLKSEGVTE